MKFKYIGNREGVFYGTHVVPDEFYSFGGEQERLALKSKDFETEDVEAFLPKKKKKTGDK